VVEARFKDTEARQVLDLTPALKGRRIVIEFKQNMLAVKEDASLCVGEIGLRNGATELLTPSLAQRGGGLNASSQKYLRQWHDDVSAPTKTLLLLADGTFRFESAPLIGNQKAIKLRGKWSATNTALILDSGSKRMTLPARITTIDDGAGAIDELMLTASDGAPDSVSGSFRPAPLRFP
jgi:hypothetical protein